MNDLPVHVIETGRLTGNHTFLRAAGWSSLLRRRRDFEFPVYSFIVEHPDGHIAIDTGLSADVKAPRPALQRRFVPSPTETEEIGPRMRAIGLRPEDVRQVVLTHLDWDHAGGLAHFPNAEVLVHRPEWDYSRTVFGRQRYEPALWPTDFAPTIYDLGREPYGPFAESKTVTADGTVRIVPLPGHTVGQVGVIVGIGDFRLLFCADHVLRQDWFVEDYAAGRLLGLGIWNSKLAVETSRRIHRFMSDVPTVLVPSHDEEAPDRIATMEPPVARTEALCSRGGERVGRR